MKNLFEPDLAEELKQRLTRTHSSVRSSHSSGPSRCTSTSTTISANSAHKHIVKIREIVESDSWQLRYPVGPDAQGLLEWRASMTDEQWVASAAVSDEEWVKGVRETFGLNVTL